MHGYDAKDLGRSFRTVRKNTIQIAEEIPEDKYDFRPSEGGRSVAETLRHIAVTTNWPIQAHGERLRALTVDMFPKVHARMAQAEAELKTKSDIVKALHRNGEEFAEFMEGLSDDVLAETVSFPPQANMPPKTRFEMLLSTKEHEMHHRAQLMVIERMLGIVPHLTRAMEERQAAMLQQHAAGAKGA
jgi:uncharacterized damage-inducible protein DinB